jgi:hypothetical protein
MEKLELFQQFLKWHNKSVKFYMTALGTYGGPLSFNNFYLIKKKYRLDLD